ncbi:hypothetical protein [Euzebya tangerina]|nr:hypothetical protein [Euzebya tangerina]
MRNRLTAAALAGLLALSAVACSDSGTDDDADAPADDAIEATE